MFYCKLALCSLFFLPSLFIVEYALRHYPRRNEARDALDPPPLIRKLSSLDVADITTFSTVYSMSYSWEGIATAVDPDDWLDECAITFQDNCCFEGSLAINYSLYDLKYKPAGLCAEFLACAFTKCDPTGFEEVFTMNLANSSFKDIESKLGPLNLPQKIAFPTTVSDVVAGIQQAKNEGLTISIKSTGHSYTGSHTKNGSIQLNFRDLQKYSSSSVIECASVTSNASDDFAACALANARGKDALVRVGGGETWNDVYNAVLDSAPQYEPLGGASGSVGAAGGWLQGGGVSTGIERMYGLGVDQVLEIEMVLADSQHIKFWPSNWTDEDGFLYPRTTAVEGQCNSNVAADESQWVWGACEEPAPPFIDLWFAVRGGGGGTYGALTSLKYQLHEAHPRYSVSSNETTKKIISDLINNSLSEENQEAVNNILDEMRVFFTVDLLYNPQELNISTSTSNQCGSSELSFTDPNLYCFGDAADQVIEAWKARVKQTVETFPILQRFASLLESSIIAVGPFTSYKAAAMEAFLPGGWSRIPAGHLPDAPPPAFTPWTGYGGWCSALIPASWLAKGGNDVYQVLSIRSGGHTTGGNVATAQDQMTAVPQTERNSGLASTVLTQELGIGLELQERLLSSFLEDAITNGSSFPGISEWNHICVDSYGPLRTNMSMPCPANFTDAQKEKNCYSIQESIWGPETLERLENIKYSVDPGNLFDCYPCVKPKQRVMK